ncbi:MAG: hypothetical protein ABI356_12300 [Steroidobacteraceae bacterium]
MNYQDWEELFGRAADDSQLRKKLVDAGIKRKIKIARDELSETVELKGEGMEITFTDDSVMRPNDGGIVGRAILSEVMMVFDDAGGDVYKGPMPHKIKQSDSRATLRAKFGKPKESSSEFRWDAWLIDGLTLTLRYSQDLKSLRVVSLSLPEAE